MQALPKGDNFMLISSKGRYTLYVLVDLAKTGRTDIFRSKKLQKDRIFPKNIWKAYSKPLLIAICLRA